jgi:conjugal transfer/entry exclusion protein
MYEKNRKGIQLKKNQLKKLSKIAQKIVKKLSKSCQKLSIAVKKLSKSCQKDVKKLL